MFWTKKEISAPRRSFLKLSLSLLILPFFAESLKAQEFSELNLKVCRNDQVFDVGFIRNGKLDDEGYIQLCQIFKDVRADVAVQMDPELFKIIALGQNWLARFGYTDPIILTSAYRTFETNMATEGAANNSLHQYGKAADMKYPGLSSRYLAMLFKVFGATGIGIYPTFVHIDTWKERVWFG